MKPEELRSQLEAAVAAHQRGDLAAAEQGYRTVLTAAPAQPEAVHFLGLLLHQRGRSAEAMPWLRHALALAPTNHLFKGNLAGVLQQCGQGEEAERLYREALELNPAYIGGHISLGLMYASRGDHPRALAEFARALALDPDSYHAWVSRGESLQQLARLPEAVEAYRRAAAAADGAEQLLGAALGLRDTGQLDEAELCHRQALQRAPYDAAAESNFGNLFAVRGDLAAAEEHYRRAIELKPDYAQAYFNLTDVKRLTPADPLWPGLMRLAERDATLPADEAIPLHFTLARTWEALKEPARSFSHLETGNRLKRAAISYDEPRQSRFFTDFARIFDADFVNGRALDSADPRPVFIVGMPRSGTTLVEQILASHPQVHGAGEVHVLRNALREELPPDPGDYALPEMLAGLDRAAFVRVAGRYGTWLDTLAPGAARITNKLPGNMVFVGLVALLYPQAKIIHCSREPLDTCLSCYSKLFSTGHPFAYEQGELGRFYRMYDALMVHWRSALPGRMLELRYEELVEDLETQAQRLVAHLDLPWDEACLRFHESSRVVRTASLAQVRQPIYKDSMGRWKRYEKELAPLIAALKSSQ
ncbi:MAG TPA: sulfotransferase [Gammaproteobacteria bacterium]|nr:sulfotransferase [Gammaproteobacteria bacterium]